MMCVKFMGKLETLVLSGDLRVKDPFVLGI